MILIWCRECRRVLGTARDAFEVREILREHRELCPTTP